MNAKKLVCIVVIFVVASAGWQLLGKSLADRTRGAQRELGADVARMFGPRLVQTAPVVATEAQSRPPEDPGRTRRRPRRPGPRLVGSDITVAFEHENRYRGLIWFSVYKVRFEAAYRIAGGPGRFRMVLPEDATLDQLSATLDGRELRIERGEVGVDVDPPAVVKVAYVSTGQDRWQYDTQDQGLNDFRLVAHTDFDAIDYPADGLSPTGRAEARPDGGKTAVWAYRRMLPARNRLIGIVMPSMPSAGELSARIATFAPVSLFFFLTVMVTIQLMRSLRLHPINYLLIAAGFFAFHILLAYLVDHLSIHLSFWVAAGVSVLLVTSYLRLVLGARAAIRYAGAAQMVFLVFFSYAFFWRGYTGLTVVIGAVATLFLIMQLTGRIDWEEKFPDLRPARTAQPSITSGSA
ncbi:MAG: inner membrane CreD family protein [Planctomycetota bacterium]